jgi:lipoprotein-releasing system permease protein
MIKKLSFSVFLGLRNFYSFRKGKKRTMAGAAIAVALSIIPLVVVLEISDGMIEGITRRFIELETGHIQVVPFEQESLEKLLSVSEDISQMDSVTYAAPVYRGTALIYSEETRTGIQLKALPVDIYEKDKGFRNYLEIIDGAFDIRDESSIMLSAEIADQLNVETGDDVKVLTAKKSASGKILLRPEKFSVSGIFSTGYYEVDAMSGYINLDKGERLFRGEGFLSIQCKIKDVYKNAEKTAYEIQSEIDIDASALTWYSMQRSMYESLHTTRVLLIFIMAVIVVVASVNITSSMIIMVIEKQQDIAILKSCGADGSQIRMSFMITGMATGLAGVAAGIAVGLVISLNINRIIRLFQIIAEIAADIFDTGYDVFSLSSASAYYLEEIPVNIDIHNIILVAAGAVLLSTAASIIPAKKAEKLMPLEIMRKH